MRAVVMALFLVGPAIAQAQATDLRVATRIVKPFVIQDGNDLQGFSIELWREIALRLGTKSQFVVKPTVQDVLKSVKSKESALGIAAISITSEREE